VNCGKINSKEGFSVMKSNNIENLPDIRYYIEKAYTLYKGL